MKENSLIAKNPTAYHNYEILEKYEAGIVLSGTEIKSIVNNKVNLKDSYAIIRDSEVWSINIHISPYEFGNRFNLDPTRNRKLLLNRREINKLIGTIEQKGLTLVITCMYWNHNKVKVELGVAKGKKLYDKREDMKRKDAKRDIERSMKNSI